IRAPTRGENLAAVPSLAPARRTVSGRIGATPPNPLPRASSRDRRNFEALGGRELRRRDRRMRYRKDAHLSGSDVRQFEREAFHGAGNRSEEHTSELQSLR